MYALEHSVVGSVKCCGCVLKYRTDTHTHAKTFWIKISSKRPSRTPQKEMQENCIDNGSRVLRAKEVLCTEEDFISEISLSCILKSDGIWRTKKKRESIHEQNNRKSESLFGE